MRSILKARRLWCTWVTHNAQYFADWKREFDYGEPNFDEATLFEVIAWNWRGECLIVRRFEGVDDRDPRPQVSWSWVHSRYLDYYELKGQGE